jgi:selenocysteine lyase/cysteine desulfurase
MLGSMAALPLAIPGVDDDDTAEALRQALVAEHGIQVPIGGWPVRAARADGRPSQILIRISAQRYNEPADYERLGRALRRRVARA